LILFINIYKKDDIMGLLNSVIDIAANAFSGALGNTSSSSMLNDAINTKWAAPAGFTIETFDKPHVSSVESIFNSIASNYGFGDDMGLQNLNMLLSKVQVTSLETAPIEVWSGGVWSFTSGRPTTRQLTLTFHDTHNGNTDNSLYKKFLANYWYLYNLYPSEQKWKIKISANDAFFGGTLTSKGSINTPGAAIVDTKSAILQSVGDLKYSQSSNALMTFDVIFKFYEAQ
jgi:hypothetical protein